MGHCCVSSSPGCVVPAPVGLMANQGPLGYFLDSRFRGNDTLEAVPKLGFERRPQTVSNPFRFTKMPVL